ncbi:unnamed protein product [Prorocentrum cordatum]|uniref:Uncharacterized protein n=1 Tax=Prorocentrum cordatum TaxID=2364126 RepID=A0ABN9RVG4_9DINO|nr:unnamed protein product [Polarella glacialis]
MVLLRFGRRAVRYAKILSTAPIRATDNNLDNRTPSMPPAWQKQVVKARSSVAARSCATNYIMREHERQCERAGVRQKAGPLWPARACERLRGNSRGKEGRGRDRERKRPASSAWATVASAAERHWKTSSRDHDDLMHRSISSHAKPRRRPQPCNLLEGEEEEGEEEEEEETRARARRSAEQHIVLDRAWTLLRPDRGPRGVVLWRKKRCALLTEKRGRRLPRLLRPPSETSNRERTT